MRRFPTNLLLLALLALLPGCSSTRPADSIRPAEAEGRIEVVFLHMNDVYEITPIEGGQVGGLARVAALERRLRAESPHVVVTHGGDLVSPSAMGTAEVDGEPLAGRQMIAVLNQVGVDWITFGNHEFDIGKEPLLDRMKHSEAGWISSNVTLTPEGVSAGAPGHAADRSPGEPFPGLVESTVLTFDGDGGSSFRIGLIGGTIQAGDPPWVRVTEPLSALEAAAKAIAPEVDMVLALTHLNLSQDVDLVESVPEIDLVLGGHEHENFALHRGHGLTPVLKADANVRTVFVVRLSFDPATGDLSIRPELVEITDAIPDDPETAAVVEHWVDRAFDAFRGQGFEPDQVVATTTEDLDGREAAIRNQATNMTDLLARAMLDASPGAVAAVVNSGSVRIDDVLSAGPVTQYDVLRVLPFGGDVEEVEMSGALLRKVLDQGVENRGSGGFLAYAGITRSGPEGGAGEWSVAGAPLSDSQTYRVALTDFLLTGRERGLDYLTPDNPDLRELGERGDIRQTVIEELRRRYGGPPG